MTDSDELLSKADALLARWRSGAVVPRPPADYPLLTEVVKGWAADELPHLPPLEASRAPADAGTVAIEELARRLAVNIARDARDDILTLVRVAVQSAVARELDARRDERSGDR